MLMSLASTPLPSPSLPWQRAQSVAPYSRFPSAMDAGFDSIGFLRSTSSWGILVSAADFALQPNNPKHKTAQRTDHRLAIISSPNWKYHEDPIYSNRSPRTCSR